MKTGLPYSSPVFSACDSISAEVLTRMPPNQRRASPWRSQDLDTETSILGDHSPVPESGSLRFGVGSFDFFTFCIKQATGLQSHFKLVKLILDGGLRAVDVQTLRTTVAGLAVLYVRLKGVVVVLTQVAGYAGVDKRVVPGGASLNVSGSGDAKHYVALRTVVSAPVGAVNRGRLAICTYRVRKDVTDLVTVGAQVAFAAIIGLAFDFEHVYRSGCLEAPVGISVARVYVVTGTAVLASWFITRSVHFVGALPSGDHGAEAFAGVTAATTRTLPACIRLTCSVPGLRPSSLLAGDQ